MVVHEIRSARAALVAAAAAALSIAALVGTSARGAATDTSCPSAEPLSLEWTQRSPTIAAGDTGCAVAEWQTLVNDWLTAAEGGRELAAESRNRLAVDGVFGSRTDEVTRHFQAVQEVGVDGVVGPVTRWAYLIAPEFLVGRTGSSTSASVLAPGSHGLAVAAWQSALNRWFSRADGEAGQVEVDGALGPETERATERFQAAWGLTVDGVVGPSTRAALADALADVEPAGGAPAPAEAPAPAAGICERANGDVATITLATDAPTPRCLIVLPTQRLHIENGPSPVTVRVADFIRDLAPREAATIGPAFGTYLAAGVHTVHASIYEGGGPQLWLTG